MRKIIHVDMDAFYAAVEQRDHPELQGKPIAIGHDGPRGVVSTASYEARQYGVHSAMSIAKAKRLCPTLLIVPHHGERYHEVSTEVRQIFHEYTDAVEPTSIDEAFLDVTENKFQIEDAKEIAIQIKAKILERTHLTASAGVSFNKFLAKIASEYQKPDGLFEISADEAYDFIGQLRIEDFWGVGPKTAVQMHKMGIFVGSQLRQVSEKHLVEVFGKLGHVYYQHARGCDDRPVVSEWLRKSVGCERTFLKDISNQSAVLIELYHTVLELVERIEEAKFEGKTLTLKIKFYDFEQITRSVTISEALTTKSQILPLAKQLLKSVDYSIRPIRLLGLAVSNPWTEENIPTERRWEEEWIKGFENL